MNIIVFCLQFIYDAVVLIDRSIERRLLEFVISVTQRVLATKIPILK